MNIRNLVLFLTTVTIYLMVWGEVINVSLNLGHSPTSFALLVVYIGIFLTAAILYPVFDSMYKDIFKSN